MARVAGRREARRRVGRVDGLLIVGLMAGVAVARSALEDVVAVAGRAGLRRVDAREREGRRRVVVEAGGPPRGVGEVVVLNVTPTASSAMVVFALEDVYAGDTVELDEQQ